MNTPTTAPSPALTVRDLAVRRGERLLVERLSFTVAPGRVLLLRGPNGAGKSSLLLTLAGLLQPAAGTIGYGTDEDDYFRHLHFVGHQPGIKARLTLRENLDFWIRVFGGSGQASEAALAEVGLGGLGGLEAGYLSSGQTRRLALARLLVAERPVWLLDEPTAGLDSSGDAMVGRLIARHAAAGGITLAATHHDLPLGPDLVHTLTLGTPK